MMRLLMILPFVLLTKAVAPLLPTGHRVRGMPMAQLFLRTTAAAEYSGLALWAVLAAGVWAFAALSAS